MFTSGATESNNISVKGVARFYRGKKRHVVTTQTEHKCVLDSCRQLEAEGFEVTYLPVNVSFKHTQLHTPGLDSKCASGEGEKSTCFEMSQCVGTEVTNVFERQSS